MDQPSQSRQGLLQEGLASYPEALIAVRDFQNGIQERCQDILRRRLNELGRAMQLPAALGQIKPYTWPDNPSKINLRENVELGAMWLISGLPKVSLNFHVCISWWSEDDMAIERYASAFLWTDNRELLSTLAQRLEGLGRQAFESDLTDRYFSVSEQLLLDDPEACLRKVEDMVAQWITLWNAIGGLQAVLPPKSQT